MAHLIGCHRANESGKAPILLFCVHNRPEFALTSALGGWCNAHCSTVERTHMADDSTHYSLLKTLEDNPSLSQRDLAKRLGISLGKVNFCLNALVEKGFLKINNFRNSNNKLAYAYVLTPRGIEMRAKMTVRFLKYKVQEYERLKAEIEDLTREAEKQGLLEDDHE